MRFDPIDTFDPARQTTGPVVRPRRWPSLLAATLLIVGGVAALLFLPDLLFRLVFGLFLTGIGLVFAVVYRRLRAPRAWLMAIDAQGLSVMLRSPMSTPADPREETVVTFPWREIACVRPARERRVTTRRRKGKNERQVETFHYLDVVTCAVDAVALAAKVGEANATASKWTNDHWQSRIVDGLILRLYYSGPSVSNAPSLKHILATLAGHTSVREEIEI